RLQLVVGLAVGERGLESLEPVASHIEAEAWRLLASGVEREQLARELPNGCASAALEVLPRLPSELREAGCLRVGPDVPRDLGQLLVGDVETVLPAKRQVQVVAGDARHLLRLEADDPADTVVRVDDVLPRAQLGERR